MNKPMLTGLLAGIGIAVAGGVAGFSIMNQSSSDAGQVTDVAAQDTAASETITNAPAAAPAAPATSPVAAAPSPAPAPRPEPAPVAAAAAPSTAPATPVAEECWEEEVVVQAQPRDDKAIAGTAAGAVIGGALADRLGDDDDLVTAAGAAAGAFIGRRAQRKYQENQTTTVTETRCAPVQTR